MRRTEIARWVFIAAFAIGAASALSQQDQGPPTLKPKPKPKPVPATLLVTCDLACNWKLDGEAKGHIDAGGAAKAPAELGQHIVNAATDDGLDVVEQITKVEERGQTVLAIKLTPVRDTRLKAEQAARDKAAQEARDRAAREQDARDKAAQQARDRTVQVAPAKGRAAQAEAAGLVWTDPATKLMWTKKDNGTDLTWQQAKDYCRNLQLAGYSEWHLATINELRGIYDPSVKITGQVLGHENHWLPATWHVKGNVQLSSKWTWSSTPGVAPGKAWYFPFGGEGLGFTHPVDDGIGYRALCVHRSGN
jgi:hypothetical protein